MPRRIPIICIFISFVLFSAQQSNADIALTKITAFETDANGNFTQTYFWDTIGGDQGVSNLYVVQNPTNVASDIFINNDGGNTPNTVANTAISVALTPGIHTFAVFGALPNNRGKFGLNLFFNGSIADDVSTNPIISPQISAFADIYDGLNNPSFSAIPTTSSVYVRPYGTTPGAGQLGFTSDGFTVTLTDFRWNTSDVYSLDRVGSFDDIGDGTPDAIGQFTLSVTSAVPEPSSVTLFLFSLIGLCGCKRTRRHPRKLISSCASV